MSHQPRSVYEYGDPVHEQITREERTDHYQARAHGQRLLLIADRLVSAIEARHVIPDVMTVRGEFFHVLADCLYSQDAAIDLPDFTDEKSLDALRQGRSA